MTKILKAAAFALALPTATLAAAPAFAQATSIGVVNIDQAVQQSTAWTTAMTQMQTTYAAQIAAVNTRRTAIQAELQPLVTAFQTAQQQPNPNQQALQTQLQQIQTREQAAQQELGRIGQPVALARAYVEEQIVSRLDAAIRAAMTAKRVQMVIRPEAAVSFQPTADITADVTAELNRAVPSVQITPPAGWQPGGQQQQGQAPAAQPQQQPAQQPQGR